jgi:hypothetical protein
LGISSFNEKIYLTFFPKSKIETKLILNNIPDRNQEKIANYFVSLMRDCKYLNKRIKKLTLSKLKLISSAKEVDMSTFIFEWKVSEIIKIVSSNRKTMFDYFGEESNSKILERIFLEHDLKEGLSIIKNHPDID